MKSMKGEKGAVTCRIFMLFVSFMVKSRFEAAQTSLGAGLLVR